MLEDILSVSPFILIQDEVRGPERSRQSQCGEMQENTQALLGPEVRLFFKNKETYVMFIKGRPRPVCCRY